MEETYTRRSLYYKLVGRTVVATELDEIITSKDIGNRVALSKLVDCEVSTIFLAINHNFLGGGEPILFETMVFGGEYDGSCHRYPGRKKYTVHFPKWVNYSLVITIPGWYLAWFGHWVTVFKLLWEHTLHGK